MKLEVPRQIALEGLTSETSQNGPVECLGLTFESDDARRAHFLERLREKLTDPAFRAIAGFPIGADEDILRLCDPPYYTACTNPFLIEFLKCSGERKVPAPLVNREPFTSDVSEGKNDPVYNLHTYHTKVPPKAIMRYILHFTDPGDVVFDGFCGTGMTGLACLLCGDRESVQSLGYTILDDGTILSEDGSQISRLGARRAVLGDLSPIASFIASNLNTPVDFDEFENAARSIIHEIRRSCSILYETHIDGSASNGEIQFTVWSDVFFCPNCDQELLFWESAIDKEKERVMDTFNCPHCREELKKDELKHVMNGEVDEATGGIVQRSRQVPVVINYIAGERRAERGPNSDDLVVATQPMKYVNPEWFPSTRIDQDIDIWYERDYRSLGIYTVSDFFTKRNQITISKIWKGIETAECTTRTRNLLTFCMTAILLNLSKMNRWPRLRGPLSGTLYIPSIYYEVNPILAFERRVKSIRRDLPRISTANIVSTGSLGAIEYPEGSVDYIFTDPPFGSNIIYSDLSIIWEAWLKVATNVDSETVIHRRKKVGRKRLEDYTKDMSQAFLSMKKLLRPGGWITVEFHNSKNSVWNAIQDAIGSAGMVVADVRMLDKKQSSFKQLTAAGSVDKDLVISAYRPTIEFESTFSRTQGTEDGAWAFTKQHLSMLPAVLGSGGVIEINPERTPFLLYDRMIAFHVQHGITIPLSAAEFYAGLGQRYSERDDMYFLPEQVVVYDKKRMSAKEIAQLQLFVTNEESSILWLRQLLLKKPQTFQDLQPQFMKEVAGWQKHEKRLELSELLEESFLRYDGMGEVPSQIHDYLSDNYHDMRGLTKSDTRLQARAKDRWYVPDPNKAGDLERLREKALLKEFEIYCVSTARRLKEFRLEAVRAGFKRAWQEHDYSTIIQVAGKIPEDVLQEDQKLLMWYDQALTRSGGDT